MLDDYSKFLLSCLIVSGIVWVAFSLSPDESITNNTKSGQYSEQPKATGPADNKSKGPSWFSPKANSSDTSNICFRVVTSCSAEAELTLDSCDELYAKSVLENILSTPLSIGNCAATMRDIELECPEGCRADFTSLMSLPGDMKITDNKTLQEKACLIKGLRKVSISMNCVYKKKS